MCQLCGCTQYLEQGKEAILKRAVEIVRELRLTPDNVDAYEDTERISRLIAPFGSPDDGVYQTAAWVSGLHMGTGHLSQRDEQYQAHVQAFRDIFSRLPAKGESRYIATTWHQLEQLSRELDEADLASLPPDIREALKAVNQVHTDLELQVTKLRERYDL